MTSHSKSLAKNLRMTSMNREEVLEVMSLTTVLLKYSVKARVDSDKVLDLVDHPTMAHVDLVQLLKGVHNILVRLEIDQCKSFLEMTMK